MNTREVKEQLVPRGQLYNANSVAFSADDTRAYALNRGTNLWIWDLGTMEPTKQGKPHAASGDSCLSPDGQLIAARRRNLVLYDSKTGRKVRDLGGSREYRPFGFSPSGMWLVSLEDDGVAGWKVDTGEQAFHWDETDATAFAVSPSGRWIALNCSGRLSVRTLPQGHEVASHDQVALQAPPVFTATEDKLAIQARDGTIGIFTTR